MNVSQLYHLYCTNYFARKRILGVKNDTNNDIDDDDDDSSNNTNKTWNMN